MEGRSMWKGDNEISLAETSFGCHKSRTLLPIKKLCLRKKKNMEIWKQPVMLQQSGTATQVMICPEEIFIWH